VKLKIPVEFGHIQWNVRRIGRLKRDANQVVVKEDNVVRAGSRRLADDHIRRDDCRTVISQ
jgi:hypothetical protein